MIGENATNSIVDSIFVGCQIAALIYWLGAHLVASHLPNGWGRVHWVITAMVLIVIPLGWYLVDPPSNGFEGAGRLVAYMVSWPINALGLGTLAWRLHRRGVDSPENNA